MKLIIILSLFPMVLFGKNYKFYGNIDTEIKDPFQMRDPFKKPLIKSKTAKKSESKFFRDGKYSNIPTLVGSPLEKIKVIGIFLGKNRRAIAQVEGDDKNHFIIKEGMTLGSNNGEVRAVMPGGIVLVEKIKNLYDQYEYLETLIPIESN